MFQMMQRFHSSGQQQRIANDWLVERAFFVTPRWTAEEYLLSMWILETYSSRAVETKLRIQDAFKNHRTEYRQTGPITNGQYRILMNMRDRRWKWLDRILHMDKDRLVRKVLLNCVMTEIESLSAYVPNIEVKKARKLHEREREVGEIRQSRCC